MRRQKWLVIRFIFVVLTLLVFNGFSTYKKVDIRENIFHFLLIEENQKSAFANAVALNYGSTENSCVYFMAEVLRKNEYSIPKETANITQIISILEKEGWTKNSDYRNLKPGDICFTTDNKGNKQGVPTHTYVFMKWVKRGSYDYAYICDNQAKDYENKIYHIRNIKNRVVIKGQTKDAFSFFMKES